MTSDKEDRARTLAAYMIETGGTVRSAGKYFGLSKSTVHKDLCEVLPRASPALCAQVRKLLEQNKAQRHIRGGLATRKKYEEKKGMR